MTFSYPVYLSLDKKKCLVVGGGNVAERKAKTLLESGAEVHAVSPVFTEWFLNASESGSIYTYQRNYSSEDLEHVFVVIGATNDCEINYKVAEDCKARNILVNIVDDPSNCNFIVPAQVKRGPLSISISTNGLSPMLARKIREDLEAYFGPEYSEYLELLGTIRRRVIESVDSEEMRKKIFYELVYSDIIELLKDGKHETVKERICHVLGSSWA